MNNTTEKLKKLIINALEDKKAEDIKVIDLKSKSDIARYVIIASGKSTRNVAAIANYIKIELKHKLNLYVEVEGLNNATWVIVDVSDIIVHVFYPETRFYYCIEKIWE